MKYPKLITAAVIAGSIALVSTGCGSDDDDPPLPTTTAAQTSTATDAGTGTSGTSGADEDVTNAKVRPSAATLNKMLETALDPAVDSSEKVDLVEGAEKDPAIFDTLVKLVKDNPDVTYKIIPPVTSDGPNKAKVKVQIKLPDNPATTTDAGISYTDGRWKLSQATVCGLVALGGDSVKTKMCPAAS
ncbi:hypothetical protein GII30_14165 [Gordonia amarae]|uniref:Low molecular weight antigen MTB12-like C-terminal domain-containing protein n=2 Tax=Gordonia amarae TaxID=36821 RepID=G7GPK1_9ACTN|nr:hypothetical protein [Gordonia amarae]GAB05526.1 hypothetical protein GOAMR_40_00160 [Gordonia amarae NBRC 15530]QHN18008.1 hypothetical protein GII35_14480 [Gordonia amarae]QHN22528.1 hypothetical protein GII34_14220 [Gordonia amarae]QHN31393.1 hypothetical protein GII32_14330 [Gordonia amarae]QHN40139.1 hypothetical protein GII30_14165 [Gordonia amarae]